jgi:hypothetical protein
MLFNTLYIVPVHQHLVGAGDLNVAENMGMTEDQLLAAFVRRVVNIKMTRVLIYAGVEHDLKEHVAQLFTKMLGALFVDGLTRLIYLFYKIVPDALMGLHLVPGAAVFTSQDAHQLIQIVYAVFVLYLKVSH